MSSKPHRNTEKRSEDSNPSQRDVRMRGFANRSTVESAIEWVQQQVKSLETETLVASDSAGRVLAKPIVSQFNIPGFRRAMMDGFAVRATDTSGASSYDPCRLPIDGESLPGTSSVKPLRPKSAIRIMTGAMMPEGADAVVPVEWTESQEQTVSIMDEIAAQKNVAQVGEDIGANEQVLQTGRILRPQDIGLVSAIGVRQIEVYRRPRVRLVITGNELLPPGSIPKNAQIVDSNSPMVSSLVQRDGGLPINPGIIPDEEDAIREALLDDCDVLLVSGGSSVGKEDLAPQLIRELGSLDIHGIAMRPSSPAGMGRIDNRLVFLLPGNPVSCLCAYDFFAGRAIRALGGRSMHWPYQRIRGVLSRKLVSAIGRADYARVEITGGTNEENWMSTTGSDSPYSITPIAISGASILSSTTRAAGFVIIPADSEGFATGDLITAYLYAPNVES